MHDDVASLRRSILALDPVKQRRRYPPALRARLLQFVRAHPDRSLAAIARSLGMAPQTLDRITTSSSAALVRVHIVDDVPSRKAEVRVHGPRGVIVEGLDVDGVAALFKALS